MENKRQHWVQQGPPTRAGACEHCVPADIGKGHPSSNGSMIPLTDFLVLGEESHGRLTDSRLIARTELGIKSCRGCGNWVKQSRNVFGGQGFAGPCEVCTHANKPVSRCCT